MRRLIFALVFTFGFNAFAKSSEIPARREFPLDMSVNPCTDFYKYACNKVVDSFQLPEDRSVHVFAFSDSVERLLQAKKKYFLKLDGVKPKDKREAMVKTYYSACMNAASRAAEEKILVRETKKSVGDIHERDALLGLFAANRLKGGESPVFSYVTSNQDHPLMNDLVLDVGWTSLPEKTYYENSAMVAELNKLITDFFITIGETSPEKKAKAVVDFEKGLAKANLSPVERRDIYAVRTGITKADLLKNYPLFKLPSLLDLVPDQTHIRHIVPRAMDFLHAQLEKMPLEDLKSIYLWNALGHRLDDAYPKFFAEAFAFENKNFGGPAVRPDRQERCTRDAMGHFLPEVDNILWRKIFPNFPTKTIVGLAEKIRTSIVHSLKENTWLSKTAQKEAIRKIQTATLQLVAPQNDEEWNFKTLTQYDLEKPIQNEKQYRQLALEKDLIELKGPISAKRWGMGPLTVNAYYDESYNKFVLPVGILQYPFFDGKAPLEVNLAAVGSVIGHELGHGIDDKGSLYDADGTLKTWMTEEDLKSFGGRTKILVTQFNAAGQRGELTLGENIGDLVGVTASHSAAFDGKSYDQELEKAYFTQWARSWCNVMRPKLVELQIKTNPHSQGVARVNEQIKQQPAFKKAFQCKETDAMVLPPEKLVHIW